MLLRRVVMMAFAVAFSATPPVAADGLEDAAQAASASWLKLVDGGEQERAWDSAALLLKLAVHKADWVEQSRTARRSLGRLLSRKVRTRESAEPSLGRLEGATVVICYESVFEHRAAAVETVVPILDPDGVWRVSAYAVQ